jgi:quercetin dioxygenase-like cupin family protein
MVHAHPARDRRITSPVLSASIRCSKRRNRHALAAWHTHPLGQTLIVTAGFGWAQRKGGQIEEIRPGDVIWFAPGEKHWHGATPTTAITHIAIQEAQNGKTVEWLEKVADEQYRR